MEHFYFKYLTANAGIARLLQYYDKSSVLELEGNIFPVSIYFGRWKASQFKQGLEENPKAQSYEQIKQFYDLARADHYCYLWVFYRDKILQLKVVGTEVFDGTDEFIDEYGSLPKSLDVELVKVHSKIELPEAFSNINSNQGYNRKTITKLKGTEGKVACSICNKKAIEIHPSNYLYYLSPTEFETLIFLIFTNKNVICSSYRGGTLKDYDLRIKVFNHFHGINSGYHWVQVKYKKGYIPKDDMLTVSLNDCTDWERNIIGIDWLMQRVRENPVVSKWLKDMIFDYSVYKVTGI